MLVTVVQIDEVDVCAHQGREHGCRDEHREGDVAQQMALGVAGELLQCCEHHQHGDEPQDAGVQQVAGYGVDAVGV